MEHNEMIYETARFFEGNQKPVHITLVDGKWLNGIIVSINSNHKDRLVLQEEKFGEMLIFFERIIEGGIMERLKEEVRK